MLYSSCDLSHVNYTKKKKNHTHMLAKVILLCECNKVASNNLGKIESSVDLENETHISRFSLVQV